MAKKNRAVDILKNATSNYVRQVLQIAIFVVLTPFIVRKVGAEDFGLWSLIQATIGLLGLMDMGFSTSVVKYVAEARGAEDHRRVGDLTATFFWQYTALGALTLLVTVCVVPFLPQILGIAPEKAWTAQLVFGLIGLRAGLGLPLGLFAGILVGYQKQLLSNVTRVFGTASYAILTWWALSYSPTIETLSWVSLGTGVFANLLSMFFCLTSAPGMSISPLRFRFSLLGEVSAFSLWFFLIQVSLLLATRVDTIVINAVLPLTAVAVYTVAIRIAERAQSLCRQLTNTLTPVIAELKGAGEEKNIRAVFVKGSMLAVASSVPMLLSLAWLATDICVVWMGEEFRDSALPCRLLLAATMVSVLHSNTENVLSMTGHQRFLALSTLGGQLLNLGLTIALVRPFGLAGVAFATLVAQLLTQLCLIQLKAGRLYNLPMTEFYWRSLWPSVPGSATSILGMWLAAQIMPPTSLLRIAILMAIGGAAFLPGFWLLGLRKDEREYLGGRLKLVFKRRKKADPPVEAPV
ncbi:oligosaccharide flippase family protein [bacterium]|nr:oligosaccharide flippase family protein [bacterium]